MNSIDGKKLSRKNRHNTDRAHISFKSINLFTANFFSFSVQKISVNF